MTPSQSTFSIIIPTYNRPKQLTACLLSLGRLEYPHDRFEVIVVDDGSDKSLDHVIARVDIQLDIKLIRQNNAGPAAARNKGAEHAKGIFLAFTDDDCQPCPDWLQVLTKHCARNSCHLVGGSTINSLPHNLFSTASQDLVSYLYQYYNGQNSNMTFFASNNIVIPARCFRIIGGFNTSFPLAAGEDREFCDRWLHNGFHTVYAPEAVVKHAHAMTLVSFCRQHFNYGRGAFYFHRIRSRRCHTTLKVEPFSFYRDLLMFPVFQSKQFQSILLTGLMFISQLANSLGFFWEKWQQKTAAKT
jgi:glycosyltransferase involved in cell wall biosynthesis